MNIGYDYNCPSVQSEIEKRTCSVCFLYHSSVATVKRHKRLHSSRYLKEQKANILKTTKQTEIINNGDSESEDDNQNSIVLGNEINVIDGAPLIQNIFDFLASDFVEL